MFQKLSRRRFQAVAALAMLTAALWGPSAYAQSSSAPLFDQLPESIKASKVIRVAGDVYSPYRIVGADGRTLTGLDADMMAAMEPLLGVKFEQTVVSTQLAMLTGIDTGRYDFAMGPLLSTQAREARYDMMAWLMSKPAFIVPASRKTSKLDDLCGLRVAIPAGSAQETTTRMLSDRCTSKGLPAVQLVPMSDQNVTVLAMQSGRADATGMQLAAGLYLAQQNPGKFHIQTDETNGLGILHQSAIVKKGSPLGPVIHEAFKRIHASGEYDRIMNKYGLGPARQPEIVMNPATKGLTADSPIR